jgi:hypothetical protein
MIDKDLVQYLRPLGRRLRLREAQLLAARTLWLPLLAAALVLLAGRLVPLAGYSRIAWLPLALWLVAVPGYGLLRPLAPARVARHTDAALGLRDRLSTALELGHDAPERSSHFDPTLVLYQQTDALNIAHALDPRQAFPLRWPRRPLALAAIGLAIALLLSLLPNPMDAVLAERAAVAAAAEEKAEQLEQLAEELAQDKSLDPADREELLRQLREAAERLRANPGDRERALADLARLEEALRRQLDPQSAARQAALEELAADLAQLAGAADQDPTLDEAARLLEELAEQATEMSAEEREALAGALEEAAGQLAGSDAGLAQALSQMAQSLRQGEAAAQESAAQGAVVQSAQDAADALRAVAGDAALQQALAQALNQAQGAADALARAGQSGQAQASQSGQGQGQQGQGQQGQGQGQQSQGQSQGQGQGQGQPGSGGGTSARTLPPGTRTGRAGDPTDPNKDYQVGELDSVFAPWQQSQPGEPDFLPGRQTGEGEETAREGVQPQPGAAGASLVPYAQVYASYAAAAAEAMEREYVPTGLRDYVRDYFTQLEP